ncbi:heme oxygenase (decycling) 1 [Linnemannia zychae]|nr:heme oxygenase (decycling) 1 [Linnemannia zychae]
MTLLAVELKESTKAVHVQAERSKFMKYFFKGEVSPEMYGRFLISLYHIYDALEKALEEHKDNPNVALVYFPEELNRKQPLEQDLAFFNGPEWRKLLSPITPAQQTYINAIQSCASSPYPERLIAHSYVRYLGDLSGGQMLSKKLQKYNELPEGQGVAFYHFEQIEDVDQFKEMYRKRLNQIEVDDTVREMILNEAQETFVRNIDIFEEFDHELVGLPLTKREEREQREYHEKHHHRQQEPTTTVKNAEQKVANNGFLGSFAPSNLWSSIVNAVRYPISSSVEKVDA